MSSTSNRRGMRSVIAAAGFSLVAAPLTLLPSTAHAATVDITLLNINDFHGRIDDNTVAVAGTIETLREQAGDANTLFLSAGDNIGASLFASAVDSDNPTIDVLNALDLKASATGNHEFDRGLDDLNGHVSDRANFEYLAANVYQKGTTTPALQEYKTFAVGGVTVGVIGAITEETPSLVSPGGIATLDFGDPVEAVNRVAGQLSDGNEANGEADVIVAEFHEGAVEGTPTTLDENVARGGAFADIVNETSAEVDAIFTGHTHMEYAYNDAPKPGGGTRPIVQTGSYGENIGKITLTVDDATGEVTTHTAENTARLAPTDADGDGDVDDADKAAFTNGLTTKFARVAQVKTIVDAALAKAKEVGEQPVGEVTDDITTAYAGGHFDETGTWVGPDATNPAVGRDDRQSESTIGNLVANALRDTLASAERGGAQIGVVNPGGLRNELFYAGIAGADTNKDGVVTFAEANAVLPFVNNLWTVTLKGKEFKKVLEEQWQPDGSSRPFLHLGLSDNVSTTLDPSKPRGERVTSVLVDGQPLQPEQEYVIGTFSFLAQGGDNFTSFTEGTSKDSGLVDREGWIEYLQNHQPVSPSFDRRQVYASGIPDSVVAGQDVAFKLERLDLTSLGSPRNTSVAVSLRPATGEGESVFVDNFAVTDGTAEVSFQAPTDLVGSYTVTAVARPSLTTVGLPVLPNTSTLAAQVRPERVVVRATHARVLVDVSANGFLTDGTVTVFNGARSIGSATVSDGKANVRLEPFRTTGTKSLRVVYSGGTEAKAASTPISVKVVKATPKMRITVRPDVIRADRTHPRVRVKLTAPGQTVRGFVSIRTGGDTVVKRLRDGVLRAKFAPYAKPGKKQVRVHYLGNDLAKAVRDAVTVRVRR